METKKNFGECVLCGFNYAGMGNNPYPLSSLGRCCDACNIMKVIPARLTHIRKIKNYKWE